MEQDPRQLAEELRERMRAFGMPLDYDRASVARLAGYLDHNREQIRAEQAQWLALFGAFLGECLIQGFGGRWELQTSAAQWRVVLGSADKTIFPIDRVARHLTHGPAESILALYDAVAADKTRSALGHGSKWGINADTVCCPRCGASQPAARFPRSFRQMLWGGWTCKGCGCEMDKWGRERARKQRRAVRARGSPLRRNRRCS